MPCAYETSLAEVVTGSKTMRAALIQETSSPILEIRCAVFIARVQ